jgi:apolipoprotein N-acyltransferase
MTARPLAGATVAAMLLIAATRAVPWLAWLVCAPLVWASLDPATGRAGAAALGAAFALASALGLHASWLAEAAERYFSLPSGGAMAAAIALCAACALPSGIVLGLSLRAAATLPGAWVVPASAAIWVCWETLTHMLPPYYPWIGLAVTQSEVSSVLQLASIAGQAGLSLVLAASGAALGYGLHHGRSHRPAATRRALAAVAGAAALICASSLYGVRRLAAAGDAVRAPACTIAGVDARIADPNLGVDELLARYEAVTVRAATARPDAIVWPESALPRDPLLDDALLPRLRALARTWNLVLVAGGPHTEWGPDWRPLSYNSAFRIAGDGPLQAYDKREPVPFAEVWPSAVLPRPSWLQWEDLAAGRDAVSLTVGACRLGILICFEVERPALAAGYAADGADALVLLSNDAQLPERAIEFEIAQSRLRAVETGLPVLRAANLGSSVAIDRYGRVTRAQGGVVSLGVASARPAPALRWSRPLLALCALAAAATLLSAVGRRSRAR